MKKSYVIAGVVALVVIVGLAVVLLGGKDDSSKTSNTSSKTASTSFKAVDACVLFSEADAKVVLGDSATKDDAAAPGASSADVKVSSCSYGNNATTIQDIKGATVLVRSALNADGAASNKSGFNAAKTDKADPVSGYGSAAYFTPTLGQLNVLDGNNWIIISSGGTNPSTHTLDNAMAVANQIL